MGDADAGAGGPSPRRRSGPRERGRRRPSRRRQSAAGSVLGFRAEDRRRHQRRMSQRVSAAEDGGLQSVVEQIRAEAEAGGGGGVEMTALGSLVEEEDAPAAAAAPAAAPAPAPPTTTRPKKNRRRSTLAAIADVLLDVDTPMPVPAAAPAPPPSAAARRRASRRASQLGTLAEAAAPPRRASRRASQLGTLAETAAPPRRKSRRASQLGTSATPRRKSRRSSQLGALTEAPGRRKSRRASQFEQFEQFERRQSELSDLGDLGILEEEEPAAETVTELDVDRMGASQFQLAAELESANLTIDDLNDIIEHDLARQASKKTVLEKSEFEEACKPAQHDSLERALQFIGDAQARRKVKASRLGVWPLFWYRVQSSHRWQVGMQLVVLVHMLLTSWECSTAVQAYCGADQRRDLALGELFVLLVYSADIAIFVYSSYGSAYSRVRTKPGKPGPSRVPRLRPLFDLALTVLLWLDFLISVASPGPPVRFTRVLRTFKLMMFNPNLHRMARSLLRCYPILDVGLLVAIVLFVYGFVGVQLFSGLYVDTNLSYERVQNFDSIDSAMLTLFALMTTDNYPMIMRPAYDAGGGFVLFFASFLVLMHMLVLIVPIAIIFESYKQLQRRQVIREKRNERQALRAAFQCLASVDLTTKDPKISYDTWEAFMGQLLPGDKHRATRDLQFAMLDVDGNELLDGREFMQLCDVILWRASVAEYADWRSHIEPDTPDWRRLLLAVRFRCAGWTKHPRFVHVTGALVLVNAATVFASIGGNSSTAIVVVDSLLLTAFTLEALIKVLGQGWRQYWTDPWNRVDFVLVALSALSELVVLSVSGATSSQLAEAGAGSTSLRVARLARFAKLARLARTVRIWRLLSLAGKTLGRLHAICVKLLLVLPNLTCVFLLLLSVLYIYACVGMEMYADQSQGWPNPRYQSFVDFPHAMHLLFQMFVRASSTWNEVLVAAIEVHEDGTPVAGSWWSASIFFSSFYLVVVVILTSLLTALIWQIFTVVNANTRSELTQKAGAVLADTGKVARRNAANFEQQLYEEASDYSSSSEEEDEGGEELAETPK